jgi:hypothetical protein
MIADFKYAKIVSGAKFGSFKCKKLVAAMTDEDLDKLLGEIITKRIRRLNRRRSISRFFRRGSHILLGCILGQALCHPRIAVHIAEDFALTATELSSHYKEQPGDTFAEKNDLRVLSRAEAIKEIFYPARKNERSIGKQINAYLDISDARIGYLDNEKFLTQLHDESTRNPASYAHAVEQMIGTVRNIPDNFFKEMLIQGFVNATVSYDQLRADNQGRGASFYGDAHYVLENRRGICTDIAEFKMQLSVAAGIPSKDLNLLSLSNVPNPSQGHEVLLLQDHGHNYVADLDLAKTAKESPIYYQVYLWEDTAYFAENPQYQILSRVGPEGNYTAFKDKTPKAHSDISNKDGKGNSDDQKGKNKKDDENDKNPIVYMTPVKMPGLRDQLTAYENLLNSVTNSKRLFCFTSDDGAYVVLFDPMIYLPSEDTKHRPIWAFVARSELSSKP